MREIEFRAKTKNSGRWSYGDLIIKKYKDRQGIHIYEKRENFGYQFVRVDKKTISEFSGLKDKNGIKIFEGDIVQFFGTRGKIVYELGSFGIAIEEGIDYEIIENFIRENLDNSFEGTFNDNFLPLFEIYYNFNNVDNYIDEIEIIGNMYENPELLIREK